MDALHQQTTAHVEQAANEQLDSIDTFFHIKALALAAQGRSMDTGRAVEDYGTRKVLPHLTESWFC
jgi:hypothetical protein